MATQRTDDYRQQSYEAWETIAPVWFRERAYLWDSSHAVGEWLADKLDPQPGQTVLEIAAGVGDTGFAAADRLGPEGRLISTDFSPRMVESARERAEQLGLENVDFRVMDAERMDLESGSVDGVICRWGYMLMADPAAALAETRRVLRPGGRLCFSVWASPDRNPWALVVGATLVERGHLPPPDPDGPGIFSMANPERVRSLLAGARFRQPQIEELPVEFPFADFEDYWRFVTEIAGRIALTISGLEERERQEIRELLKERTRGFAGPVGYNMPGLTLNVVTS